MTTQKGRVNPVSGEVRFGTSVLDAGYWFSVAGGVLVAISGSVEAFLVPESSLGYAEAWLYLREPKCPHCGKVMESND